MRRGYSLVELMIVITIITILISFGVSAYRKSQERQAAANAAEEIMIVLQEAQRRAKIGERECADVSLGEQVSITASSSTMSTQGLCSGGNETPEDIAISGATFQANATITFKPLAGGVDFGGGNSLNIDYTTSTGAIYRITVEKPGTITYEGLQ